MSAAAMPPPDALERVAQALRDYIDDINLKSLEQHRARQAQAISELEKQGKDTFLGWADPPRVSYRRVRPEIYYRLLSREEQDAIAGGARVIIDRDLFWRGHGETSAEENREQRNIRQSMTNVGTMATDNQMDGRLLKVSSSFRWDIDSKDVYLPMKFRKGGTIDRPANYWARDVWDAMTDMFRQLVWDEHTKAQASPIFSRFYKSWHDAKTLHLYVGDVMVSGALAENQAAKKEAMNSFRDGLAPMEVRSDDPDAMRDYLQLIRLALRKMENDVTKKLASIGAGASGSGSGKRAAEILASLGAGASASGSGKRAADSDDEDGRKRGVPRQRHSAAAARLLQEHDGDVDAASRAMAALYL